MRIASAGLRKSRSPENWKSHPGADCSTLTGRPLDADQKDTCFQPDSIFSTTISNMEAQMNKAAAKPDETISTLNGLIETCRDGQNGFAEAAESMAAVDLREFCLEQTRNRARFVGELQQEVRHLGGKPENTGSTAAALHRSWINLKAALGGGDHMILGACEAGEDSAVSEYEKALKSELPDNVRSIVAQQYEHIKQAHNRVKSMRDNLAD
ncbi:MAG: PA2169 family four-helix-bundle protein [Blastocatellia bacterium]